MILAAKQKYKVPFFWVEDYSQEDKEFLEGIGFVEHKSKVPNGFGTDVMDFKGSGIFGLWTQEEADRIMSAIVVYTGVPKSKLHINIIRND
jgi:hypothetical protein